jgi:hypothetical protein
METRRVEYNLPAQRIPTIVEKLEDTRRRAEKKGLSGFITYQVGEVEISTYQDTDCFGRAVEKVVETRTLTLEFDPPRLAGWEFLARVEHHNVDGEYVNMVYSVPEVEGLVDQYGNASPDCQHCNTKRQRNDTFIVRHEDGTVKQVGSTCLRDFLGIDPSRMIWAAGVIQEIGEIGELSGGFGGGPDTGLWNVLCIASASVRDRGYVSRMKAEEWRKMSTAEDVSIQMNPPPWGTVAREKWEKECRRDVTPEDQELAFGTFWWMLSLRNDDAANDYYRNLSNLTRLGFVPDKALGLAASAPAAYIRARDKVQGIERRRQEAANSQHVGTVGKRMKFEEIEVLKVIPYENDWGTTYITIMRDPAGNQIVWFASESATAALKPKGEIVYNGSDTHHECSGVFNFAAMVKDHNERDGINQTIVNRPTKIEEVRAE